MNAMTPSLEALTRTPQRILIVDDVPRMRQSIVALIASPTRLISEAGTGTDAIEAMRREEFDLVLLDIGLPDMSGLDVLEWISRNRITSAVIVVSADESIDSAIRALRNGAVEFVRKLTEIDELQRRVDSALHRRQLEKSNAAMMEKLQQSEQLHRFLVDHSPDLIYTLDAEGRFVFVNDRFHTLLGYDRDALIGQNYAVVVHPDDRDIARHAFQERRRDERASANAEIRLVTNPAGGQQNVVITLITANGIYNHSSTAPVYTGTYGVARDITERKQAEETIVFQALHDQLTQLPNRTLFKDRLDLSITQARRSGGKVGVMFLDLDRFKLVNDTHGHAEGDVLLKAFAERLKNCVRAGDTLARQGGDEFTILLPDLAQAEDASIISRKIMDSLTAPFHIAGQDFFATASIGIAIYPNDGANADELIKSADIAMYAVKGNGKNGFQFFTHEMNASYHQRISIENDLRVAIQNGEFELFFQPQISVLRNKVIGMEALIRWRHPVHGLLSPISFIELAEEAGLIAQISDWVLEEACTCLERWRAMGHCDIRMSVNLSPQEFDRNDIVERIASRAREHHLPFDALEVEITENLMLRDVSTIAAKMQELRDKGIRISIDDFGTRYSSLNYLRHFPVNSIKIDQSFVRDIPTTAGRMSPIIQAIVGVARGFDLHLVAEGVETELQERHLADLGCDEMQGFLYSPALPADEVERLLSTHAMPNPQYH